MPKQSPTPQDKTFYLDQYRQFMIFVFELKLWVLHPVQWSDSTSKYLSIPFTAQIFCKIVVFSQKNIVYLAYFARVANTTWSRKLARTSK